MCICLRFQREGSFPRSSRQSDLFHKKLQNHFLCKKRLSFQCIP
ncbi:hypothetical protein BRYFOR_06878 [Marvinbryantia formatexigens DSM 14469]|uniref:Uncharacterized protein n=1 Tax=Marvinbryantia formatexigens DSM 14469 TaxID=478749 RepID=C6LE29_9FIRM|nr:hypothetical protein BRYFOR_06878 [Marvinbryantia formatexigens DSM 14469]